ncbi:MAG: hypothetical protein M4D80_12700 [Myxococcota bacterium]|nr:hypothetical protein [Myxococcota bacterium]
MRAIEEERVADERAAVQAAHCARIAAREAEDRAVADAAAVKAREEHEAKLAIELAKVEAEREARLKIEATEAAERTRQQAILAETRLAQEMELRRAEVAKKRPTWMVAVTVVATLAAFALIYVAIERTRTSEQAKERARIAVAQEREMRRQLEDLSASLVALEAQLDKLSGRTSKAITDLAEAEGAAQTAAAKKEIDRLRAEERDLRNRQEQIRIEKERIKRKEIIKIDKKCLTQAIC